MQGNMGWILAFSEKNALKIAYKVKNHIKSAAL